MKVAIVAKVMHHDRLGKLVRGVVVDVPDHQASDWMRRGWAESADAKENRERPLEAAGTPSSALPVAPVSTEQTQKPSRRGGRPKKAEA